jgi:hypothetical protein
MVSADWQNRQNRQTPSPMSSCSHFCNVHLLTCLMQRVMGAPRLLPGSQCVLFCLPDLGP